MEFCCTVSPYRKHRPERVSTSSGNGAYVVSVEVGLELARQIQADVQRVAKDTYRTGKFAVGMMTSDEEE